MSIEVNPQEEPNSFKCAGCGVYFRKPGNNGAPLYDDTVCDECNVAVIKERLRLAEQQKNE